MGNSQDKLTEQLILAVNDSSIDDTKKLLKLGARVNGRFDGTLPLHTACFLNDTQYLRLLLNKGAKVNKVDENQETALHCVANGNLFEFCDEFVDVLIGHGANINALNRHKQTPLHCAITCFNVECVKSLLQHGADVNALDNMYKHAGRTPLYLAIKNESDRCVQLLLQYGANIYAGDISHLRLAVETNNKKAVQLMLQNGANINERDEESIPLLHWDVRNGRIDRVKLVLQHGADVDILDHKHNTALIKAAGRCMLDIIKVLLDYNADVHAINLDLQTPLMQVAVWCNTVPNKERIVECLELLLRASGQFDLRDEKGDITLVRHDHELGEIVLPYCVHPRSLQSLCRHRIRSSLRNQFLPDVLSLLNLPQRLQSFVLLHT